MIQSGGFLGRLLGPLLKTGLPLIKNVIKPLAKSVLLPLGLTAAASRADAAIHKNFYGSGKHYSDWASHDNTILLISNNEMKKNIEIIEFLEDSSFLPEEVTETNQTEVKKQGGGFFSTLLGGGINRAGEREGQGIVRAGYGSNSRLKNILIKSSFSSSSIDEYWNKRIL